MTAPIQSLRDLRPLPLSRSHRVLLVEDNPEWAGMIGQIIAEDGREIVHAATEAEARRRLAGERFDLLLVDRQLDPGDGLALLDEFRRKGLRTHAIVLTSLGDDAHFDEGLDAGGNGYMVKPPRPADLRARVKAALREADAAGLVFAGPVEIALRDSTARLHGRHLDLGMLELGILALLALDLPRPVDTARILREVWRFNIVRWSDGAERVFHPGGRLVETTVARLRGVLKAGGLDAGFVRSHKPVIPDGIDGLRGRDARAGEFEQAVDLTRAWSIDLAAGA